MKLRPVLSLLKLRSSFSSEYTILLCQGLLLLAALPSYAQVDPANSELNAHPASNLTPNFTPNFKRKAVDENCEPSYRTPNNTPKSSRALFTPGTKARKLDLSPCESTAVQTQLLSPQAANLISPVRNIAQRFNLPKEPDYTVVPGDDERYPYATGGPSFASLTSEELAAKGWGEGDLYRFDLPETVLSPDEIIQNLGLGDTKLEEIDIRITPKRPNESRLAYHQRKLGSPAKNMSPGTLERSYLGKGALSNVYHITNTSTASTSTTDTTGADNKPGPTFKVRRSIPFKPVGNTNLVEPQDKDRLAVNRNGRKDLIAPQVFNAYARGFKFIEDGEEKPLIQALEYNGTLEHYKKGIFPQPLAEGIKASEVKRLLHQAQAGDTAARDRLISEFGSVEKAERRIAALEAFYTKTHLLAINYFKKYNLPLVRNTVRAQEPLLSNFKTSTIQSAVPMKRKAVTVGFDYNHGTNEVWNKQLQIFITFDE